MRNYICLFAILFTCSCGVNMVDDRPAPITHIQTNVSSMFIYKYTDSVSGASWNQPRTELNSPFEEGRNPDVNQTTYYFPPPHEEIYHVGFTWPIVIKSVYSDSAKKWLGKDEMSQAEVDRISKRFETEVINPMVAWGKEVGVPDSVIYGK